ncbi:transglutaminase-like domain-containing protein [Pelagicoccus mobilis]|uniref:Transglutaminase-like domain-containing protein n=1 Tax=Pelagicoccus mobilis TaxID=415221 RepID=A0A934VU16_9BACT|nr:transglutaminase-like domain-containing protein [Pelagicoccus mobilis]MBK1880298.1 hypothetical protein [Pelagicoccus mobilis]
MKLRQLSALICIALTTTLGAKATISIPEPSLELTPAMKQFLIEQNVSVNQPPLVKMQRILDGLYASEEGFTYSPEETLTASDAFEQRRGNCVSFAMLFVALAREVGLDARFNQIDYSPVWEKMGNIFVETSHINAIVFVGGSQYVIEGMPEYAEVASRNRNPIPDARVFSHYYNNSGLIALSQNDKEQARELIDTAISIDSSNGIAWQNLGLYNFQNGNQEAGEKALVEAAKRDDRSSSVCYILSQYYTKVGDDSNADKYAKLGSKRSKKNPFFQYHKSQEALFAGDLKKSIKHMEKALKLLPNYTKFKVELGHLKEGLACEDSYAKK